MYRKGIVIIGLIWVGCSSSHKLTGTDYVDIEAETVAETEEEYPLAIIKEAGWDDITTELKKRGDYEEFRIWLKSPVYPGNLYKLTKGKKGVEGEGILYWKRDTTADNSGFIHQEMQRYLEGTCIEFLKVRDYGYCFPEFVDELNWEALYNSIENQDFWQIPNEVAGGNVDKEWQMYVQMRLGNYYRDYTHRSPEGYEDAQLRSDVKKLSGAVKLITNRFKQNTNTNTFEGITDGTSFTLCDSSETWKFNGEMKRLMARAGIKSTINTEEEKSLYYVMVKGRVSTIWYNEWATGKFDRELSPTEIYEIQVVNEINCPERLTGN